MSINTASTEQAGAIPFLVRLVRFGWQAFNTFRRLVFGFLAILIALTFLALLGASGGAVAIPSRVALVVAPEGLIVEELSGDPIQRAVAKLAGSQVLETRLRDLVEAIEVAAEDDRVEALLLDLDGMIGADLTKLQALATALEGFRATEKPVLATSEVYTRSRYHLAAQADEIFLHDMGAVLLEGYSIYRSYYREGLERFEIDWNVFRVGEYKSAVEPYLRRDMSPEVEEANLAWLGDLWSSWLDDVATARGLERGALEGYVLDYVDRLRGAAGNGAALALDSKLVDHVGGPDLVRARLREIVGEEGAEGYPRVGVDDYLRVHRLGQTTDGGEVGVIVAAGTILPGQQPPGTIGGDSTAALVRRAREDDDIEVVVLRVDSGGGSALASEVIRRELALVRDAGKPVVVSMGGVAASGGYWIATASDEIWARPTTVTGSIGIYGMFPTFEKPIEKYLGIRVDGVGTSPLAGLARPDIALPPAIGEAIQLSLEDGYRRFLGVVAENRDMTVEEVDRIARGRVWSGEDAYEVGLVDGLGGLDDAITAAAEKADLGDHYGIQYLEPEMSFSDRVALGLLSRVGSLAEPLVRLLVRPSPTESAMARWVEALGPSAPPWLALEDPRGMFAHCDCGVR